MKRVSLETIPGRLRRYLRVRRYLGGSRGRTIVVEVRAKTDKQRAWLVPPRSGVIMRAFNLGIEPHGARIPDCDLAPELHRCGSASRHSLCTK
jgi:hypothetical protein